MLAFPKPEPRATGKRRAARKHAAAWQACKAFVLAREQGQCQRCGKAVSYDVDPCDDRRAHANHIQPLSLGGAKCDPANVELTCGPCHMPLGQHAPTPERMWLIQKRSVRVLEK
jgi:5-methylcytosine-specific restriction endonuclease McrA